MLEQHEIAALFSALQVDPPGVKDSMHDKSKKILDKYIDHLGKRVAKGTFTPECSDDGTQKKVQ